MIAHLLAFEPHAEIPTEIVHSLHPFGIWAVAPSAIMADVGGWCMRFCSSLTLHIVITPQHIHDSRLAFHS